MLFKLRLGINPSRQFLLTLKVLFLTLFFYGSVIAQQCTGTLISAGTTNIPNLNATDLVNGATSLRYLNIHFATTRNVNCRKWSLNVRATGSWRSGNNVIDVRNTSLRFNTIIGGPTGGDIGISSAPVPISLSEVSLVNKSREPLDQLNFPGFDMKYDLVVRGGGDQLINAPNGIYSTTLVLVLSDEFGNTVNSTTARVEMQINQNTANTTSVSLQNGASNISLAFNNSRDFVTGVSDVKIDGLNVVTYTPHQVIVKASSNRLMSFGNSRGFPVSAIRLDVTTRSAYSAISCYSVDLSDIATVVADNPMINRFYQNVPYTLKFSIAGNNPNISNADPGDYNTSIVFIIIPK
jgi:hypothetical protein